jgi:glycosyltransferase involved in cell wall biosynthesis
MFAARPIVASDIAVHRETIAHRETGLLVRVGNPEAIARGIIAMLKGPNEAQKMAEQARKMAMKRFHIDRIATQYEELYEEVLRRCNKRK